MRAITTAMVSFAAVLAVALCGCTNAVAASPWWHLSIGSRPAALVPGEEGQVVLVAHNLGDAPVNAETTPVTLSVALPPGLEEVAIEGFSGTGGGRPRIDCPAKTLTCSFSGTLPPYFPIEILVSVRITESASGGEQGTFSVSGGDVVAASISRPLRIGAEATPFGIENYELSNEEVGGVPDTLAGSHPFQQTTTLTLNQTLEREDRGQLATRPARLAKDLHFHWPPGLIGNPQAVPRCSLAQFNNPEAEFNCPPETAVGIASTTLADIHGPGNVISLSPLFNLEPAIGEPARFGFIVDGVPILINPAIRSEEGGDYGLTVSTENIAQTVSFLSSEVTVWGVPDDSRHDISRGWGCLQVAEGKQNALPCHLLEQSQASAFFTLPTACSGMPLQTSATGDSWAQPNELLTLLPSEPSLPALDGCNQLHFEPTVQAEPSTDRASAPSGLDVNIDFHDEGLTNGEGAAQSQLKDTVVTLPEGLTINPSAGVGLGGCTQADYARETLQSAPGTGCPDDSKLGTVEIETPLLTQKIQGSLFIAEPYENPFPEPGAGHPDGTLVALYIVAKNPETGVLIKLAGKVTPDPVTGRLVTTFADTPQLPFAHFNFHFREGQQAPLISPPTCGTYTTQAQLTPWSEPTTELTDTSQFTITKGFDGGACPAGGVQPFHPGIVSGTLNNNAGSFSPFYLHLTRTDAEQEISGFSTDLPNGLTGDLSGIPFCHEAAIAAARVKSGAEEEASPSCPAASQIGHTLVGTGVGAVLAYVPGKLYLAGPYNGDPFSLVSVTSARVGPFDLGTVVLRFALRIDPETARVSVDPTASEPIPHIIRGIVTHVRDIRVYIDRQNFILNPTSCEPLAISSTLTSNLGQSTNISSPFQAVNCAHLGFKPKFSVSTSGRTSRANGASLDAKISYPSGAMGTQANIRSVKVKLPKQLPSRLSTLQEACTDKVFNANPAACPAASRIGQASATTPILPVALNGPVYFVSHAAEKFPELVIVLSGYGVTVDLHGETFISKAGITSTTFNTVPDVPVGSFELKLPEGKYSALAANGNLCKQKLVMPTRLVAQNGAVITQSTKIVAGGCPKPKVHKKPAKHKKKK